MPKIKVVEKWLDPKEPGSYGPLSSFLANQPQFRNHSNVLKSLSTLDSFGIHQGRKRSKKFPKVVTNFPDFIYSCDLIDYRKIKYHNNRYSYILVIVCVFSKFTRLIPLKSKTSAELTRAFDLLFKTNDTLPSLLWWDQESAIKSKEFQQMISKYNIKSYFTFSPRKSVFAENRIKFVKSKLQRIFTERKKERFIDVLKDVENSINNTWSSVLGCTPAEARKEENVGIVWQRMYDKLIKSYHQMPLPKYKVGSRVRISVRRLLFFKG